MPSFLRSVSVSLLLISFISTSIIPIASAQTVEGSSNTTVPPTDVSNVTLPLESNTVAPEQPTREVTTPTIEVPTVTPPEEEAGREGEATVEEGNQSEEDPSEEDEEQKDEPEEDPNGMVAADQSNPDSNPNNKQNPSWNNKGKTEFRINESNGTAVYQYSLDIPTGRNNFQPPLNINYSSNNKDNFSPFGYGWQLDLATIERRGKTGKDNLYKENEFIFNIFGDVNAIKPITLNNGPYGTYGAETETNFYKIEFLNNNSWLVTDKYGTKFIFGLKDETRQSNPSDQNKIYKWYLEEIRDTNDNYIKFIYTKDANQIYPDKIIYSGHGSTDGIFEINFVKQARTDKLTKGDIGFNIKSNFLIQEIQIKIEGKIVRKYALTYIAGGNDYRSLLNSITETGFDINGANALSFPPTKFTYNKVPLGWEQAPADKWDLPTNAVGNSGTDEGVRFSDVNGDGLIDFIKAYQDSSLNGIYLNTGSGWQLDNNWKLPNGLVFTSGNLHLSEGVEIVDINGDLLPDVIQAKQGIMPNKVYINNGNGWTYEATWQFPINLVGSDHKDEGVRLVDLNGDGLIDLVKQKDNDDNNGIYLNHGKGWTKEATGKWQMGISITDNTGQSTGTEFVDINGDGLVDMVKGFHMPGTNLNKIFINNGEQWILDPNRQLPFIFSDVNSGDEGTRFVDINGDGLVDLVKKISYGGCCIPEINQIWLNNGNEWILKPNLQIPIDIAHVWGGSQDMGARLLDVDGDGLTDFLNTAVNSEVYLSKTTSHGPLDDLLIKVDTSLGSKNEIYYQSSVRYFNEQGNQLSEKLPLTIQTVKEISEEDGLGKISKKQYFYEEGSYYVDSSDVYKNTFAGFAKVKTLDEDNHIRINYFHHGETDYYQLGRPYRAEEYDNAGKLYTVSMNKWDSSDLGNGRKFVKLASSLEQSFEGAGGHKDRAISYSYDNSNGNILSEIDWGEVFGNNDGTFNDTSNDKTTTEKSYAINSSKYILATVSNQTLKDQQNKKISETRYYYDGQTLGNVNKGNLTKSEKWLDSNNSYLATTLTYTAQGLLDSTTNPRGFKTTYIYDSKNLYPSKITNSKNQSSTFVYNIYNGAVQQQTDPNFTITITEYDAFNRPKKEKISHPTDVNKIDTVKEYVYQDQSVPRRIEVKTYQDNGFYNLTLQHLDGLNRVRQIRESTEKINQYTIKNLSYDKRGNLEKEYLAYTEDGTAYTGISKDLGANTFTYDARRRPIKVSNNLGTMDYKHSPWWTQVIDANGKKKNFYYDSRQNLLRVDEIKGNSTYMTFYTYSALNQLTQIKDAQGNVRNFYYDSLGRLSKQEDLHSPTDNTFGVWNYEYDKNGNLTKLTRPAGEVINYAYDELDRITSEDFSGAAGTEVTYEYDLAKNATGKLLKVKKQDFEVFYTYDERGNIASEKKTLEGQSYTTTYSYDVQNRLKESTLPDSAVIKNTYNFASQLEKVEKKEAGSGTFSSVVKNYDYSPMGQISKIEYGNGAVTTNTYDPAKLYRLTQKSSTINGKKVQDIAYTFDAVGNITKIIDKSEGIITEKTLPAKGDVNGDLTINVLDSQCAALVSVWFKNGKKASLLPTCVDDGNYFNADIDCNSKVDSLDVALINRLAINSPFPLSIDKDKDQIHNGCEPLNPVTIKDNLSTAKTAEYKYDDLHRLIEAKITNPAVGENYTHTYQYDSIGNITYNSTLGAMVYGPTTESPYANPHAVNKIQNGPVGTKNITYNKNGEILNDGDQTLSWDYNGRLLSSTKNGVTVTFAYDHTGQRTKKNNDKYLWGNYEIEASGKIIKHIAEATVESVNGVTASYYSLDDHLSSASVLLDHTGAITQILDYYAYGASRVDKQFGNFDEKRKFTGHELDDETGLYYANARYYNPNLGRFYSLDPAALNEFPRFLEDPQQLNFYAYARNNPMKYVDPSGEKVEVSSRKIDAPVNGTHTFVRITPDTPQDFGVKNSFTFTLSATDIDGKLQGVINLSSDIGLPKSKERGSMEIRTPEGMTDTQFINKILEVYGRTDDNKDYSWYSNNCNYFTTSLIEGAGGEIPQDFKPLGYALGLRKEIPDMLNAENNNRKQGWESEFQNKVIKEAKANDVFINISTNKIKEVKQNPFKSLFHLIRPNKKTK